MKLHNCTKFCHVTRSQSHFMGFTRKKADKSKTGKFGPNFLYEGVIKNQNPANMLNNFLFPFRIWKQNEKIPFSSKVIDIWKKHMFFNFRHHFLTFLMTSSKKWPPFWIFFCTFLFIMGWRIIMPIFMSISLFNLDLHGGGSGSPSPGFCKTIRARG